MNWTQIEKELDFSTARSGGKGGQHVNKTETKVLVHLNITRSEGLQDHEKKRICNKLAGKISSEGVLQIYDQSTRSQGKNKEKAIQRLRKSLEEALRKNKKRIPTKIPKKAKEKRLKSKKIQSEKKKWRRNKDF